MIQADKARAAVFVLAGVLACGASSCGGRYELKDAAVAV